MPADKIVQIPDNVRAILRNASWSDDGLLMKKLPQLDPKTYKQVDKVIKLLGGAWNRRQGRPCVHHRPPHPPRRRTG